MPVPIISYYNRAGNSNVVSHSGAKVQWVIEISNRLNKDSQNNLL